MSWLDTTTSSLRRITPNSVIIDIRLCVSVTIGLCHRMSSFDGGYDVRGEMTSAEFLDHFVNKHINLSAVHQEQVTLRDKVVLSTVSNA